MLREATTGEGDVPVEPMPTSRGIPDLLSNPKGIFLETSARAIAAISLALTCLLGRGLNLVIPGRTPVWAMLVMFLMAASAVVLATLELRDRTADQPEPLIAKFAQRIGLIQVVFAIALVVRGLLS